MSENTQKEPAEKESAGKKVVSAQERKWLEDKLCESLYDEYMQNRREEWLWLR